MHMPHGRFMCPRNFSISTLHPMENITIANKMVKTVLRTTLKMSLKLLAVTTQDAPSQMVALAKQPVELFIAGVQARMVTEIHRSTNPLLLAG